jgi:CDP-4-dehydro-6-deoxyglucose reductase
MPRKWYQGKVSSIANIGSQTKQISIALNEAFDFIPGQFITMDLPIGEKRLDRWRSYSIASESLIDSNLELCIVKLPEGRASTYLTDEIDIGEEIKFKGPEGKFILPKDLSKEIVMVCTGTGVAPFRSMIKSIVKNNLTPLKIHLIFGTRYERDILYRAEFEALAKKYHWFEYDVTLSKGDSKAWNGNRGYVHQIYKKHYPNPKPEVVFMLCGWSMMVDEAQQTIIDDLGYAPSQVITELYG